MSKFTMRIRLGMLALLIGGVTCGAVGLSTYAEARHTLSGRRCFRVGCYCRGFEGSGHTCKNCGHSESSH